MTLLSSTYITKLTPSNYIDITHMFHFFSIKYLTCIQLLPLQEDIKELGKLYMTVIHLQVFFSWFQNTQRSTIHLIPSRWAHLSYWLFSCSVNIVQLVSMYRWCPCTTSGTIYGHSYTLLWFKPVFNIEILIVKCFNNLVINMSFISDHLRFQIMLSAILSYWNKIYCSYYMMILQNYKI